MADGIPLMPQTHQDFIVQSSPFFKRTSKGNPFFKGDSDLRGCSPIGRDYIDTSVPRFHNVSPRSSLPYERHYRIKNSESPKQCETKSHTECVNTPFYSKKRERPPVSTPCKVEASEPTSGGRWMLSALRRIPLVGSLVSSQDDQDMEKASQTATKSTREFTEDFNSVFPSTSSVNLSCDVVASPSFKCLAENSGDLQKNPFSTASHKDNFTVPLPYETHSHMFYYDAPEPTSKTRLQQKWDKSPLYTKTNEATDDLKSVLTLRRQYGLGDILLEPCEKSSEDIVQYKKPRLSSPVLSCPSDMKPSGFGSLGIRSWNPSSPKLSVSRSEGNVFQWKNEDNSTAKGIVEKSNESTERLSIRSFKKKRGLRAVDYRRLLQQAKFQPCHWIDYFDYMKAKSADDQDKQHYILNKKPFSYEADSLQETKSLSVLQNSKWGTNDETNLFKGSFSSCGKKDLKEPITSHDKTLSLAGVHSIKDMKSNTMESSDTQVLRDLVNSVPEKSQIETVPCSTQECHTIGQDISATSGIGNKDGTSFIQLKEKKGESNPIVLGNNVLKKTEQVTLNETPPVAPLPWWKSNLNKTIQVDVEGDGVFAENADDDTVQCTGTEMSTALGQSSSEQAVSADNTKNTLVSGDNTSSEQELVDHDSSNKQNHVLHNTLNECATIPVKDSPQHVTSETSVWNQSSPFVFGKDSNEKQSSTSLFSKCQSDSSDFKNLNTIQPFSLQVPSQEKTELSFNFEAPSTKTLKKPCVSQTTTSTEPLNKSSIQNNLFQSCETTQEIQTQQVNTPTTNSQTSFLNPVQTASLPFLSNNVGFNTVTKTTIEEKPSLFFNNLPTSTNTNTLLNEAAPSQNISTSFLDVNKPQGISLIHNSFLQESIQSDSQQTTTTNGVSLFKPQETTSLFNAPLTLNPPVSPFGATPLVEQPKTSLFSLPPPSTSFFGNTTTTNVTDKPFSTSPLHNIQQTTSNDSLTPGIQKNFNFSSGLFGVQQPNNSCFNMPTTPTTLKPESTDSLLNVTTPSLFNSLPASTPDTSSVVPKPFETSQVPLFSFGGTTSTTEPSNVMSINSSTSPNPFAANAGTFTSSTPRRPKLRLKRTLR